MISFVRTAGIREGDVTPPELRLHRRGLMGAGLAAACGTILGVSPAAATPLRAVRRTVRTSEKPTSFKDITHYNNFYEFGTGKEDPWRHAQGLKLRPWTVAIDGECAQPQTIDIDTLMKRHPIEERIYRHRCVEGWSMVIPWLGFPLASLIQAAEPTSRAKFVAFHTLRDPAQMPGQRTDVLSWPYAEGLRIDEATHPLAFLAVGLYGQTLLPQNGAPVRLVVPWKYGFKSIKSLVRVSFVKAQPPTAWNTANPREYGFYSNVNPAVDHPRWSQSSERRIGELFRRKTLPFNGYADQVASLYGGMDLRRYF